MKNPKQTDKVEHTKGRYYILGILITSIVAIIGYFVHTSSASSTQAVTIKGNNTNSPVAHDIQTQNNTYYAVAKDTAKTAPVEVKPKEIIRVVYKEPKKPIEKQLPPVINNSGNLVLENTGTLTQNTYNTPPKLLPRHLTNDDLELIKKTIPNYFPVEFSYCFLEQECVTYADEVANALTQMGYKLTVSPYGTLFNNRRQDVRIDVHVVQETRAGYVTLYKQ